MRRHTPMHNFRFPKPVPVAEAVAMFPTLATDQPHHSRSVNYRHISTLETLNQLESAGYGVTSVAIQRVRAADRKGFQKHALTVRAFDAQPLTRVGETFVEARIVNAHDGSAAWKIYAALLRLVCLNGMTAGSAFDHVTVRHSGADLEARIVDGTTRVFDSFGAMESRLGDWSRIIMTDSQVDSYLEQAHALRWPADSEAPVSPRALGNVRRYADVGADLWTVYNRVQENGMRGGLRGRIIRDDGTTRRVSTRGITGIDQDTQFNRALFDLTDRFARAA